MHIYTCSPHLTRKWWWWWCFYPAPLPHAMVAGCCMYMYVLTLTRPDQTPALFYSPLTRPAGDGGDGGHDPSLATLGTYYAAGGVAHSVCVCVILPP
ncbi:hypothetical protein DFP73DRAFT_568195 [Morchella snyderi]|nr:hypothetical protein DFP73DRAFT_568195 [Morchella snyderi]